MCTGSAPNAFAMVGSAVAITVESEVLHEHRAGDDHGGEAGSSAGADAGNWSKVDHSSTVSSTAQRR